MGEDTQIAQLPSSRGGARALGSHVVFVPYHHSNVLLLDARTDAVQAIAMSGAAARGMGSGGVVAEAEAAVHR